MNLKKILKIMLKFKLIPEQMSNSHFGSTDILKLIGLLKATGKTWNRVNLSRSKSQL